MDKIGIIACRYAAVVLVVFSSLVFVDAKERRPNGLIAVTFHENGANRMVSENFYVMKEGPLVRWQNFKNRDFAAENNSRKIYEITTSEVLQQTVKKIRESEGSFASSSKFPLKK